jgi:hypothetical protein
MAKGTVTLTTAFGMCALFTAAAAAADQPVYTIIELEPVERIERVTSSSRLDRLVVADKEGIVGIKVFDKQCSKLKIVTNKGVHDYVVCKDGHVRKEG